MRPTRSDDLSELLELLGADLDLADLEETGEKLDKQIGQPLRQCNVSWLAATTTRPHGYVTYLRLGLGVPDNWHGVDAGGC